MISKKQIGQVARHSIPAYYSDGGLFQIDASGRVTNLNQCREQFENGFRSRLSFVGFSSLGLDTEKMHESWMEIEKKLGIKPSVFHSTDDKKAVAIKMNKFWLKNDTTRGVMTLLLRGLGHYYHKDLAKCLASYPLASEALPAILYFLDGHTEPTYGSVYGENHTGVNGYGFVDFFKDMEEDFLGLYLISPNKKTHAKKKTHLRRRR